MPMKKIEEQALFRVPSKTYGRRPRDVQKHRLYAAEHQVFKEDAHIMEWEELQDYVREVLNEKRIRARFPVSVLITEGKTKLSVRQGRGSRRAYAVFTSSDECCITFPVRFRRKWVVLHELSHILAPQDAQSHGREFCRVYLYVVRCMMGINKEKELKAAMKRTKCKYSRTHTRWKEPLTDEQKRELLSRFDRRKQES